MSFSGRRTKWAILGAWAVLLAIFGPLGLKLPELTNDEVVLPSSSETAQANRLIAARFPGGDQKQVLLVYRRAGGLTAADRSAIASRRVRARPRCRSWCGALAAVRDARSSSRRTATSRSRSSRSPRRRSSASGRRSRSCGRCPPPGGGLERHVTGTPALLSDFNSAIKEADTTLLLATGLLVLLLLLAVYRSPILALLPLVVVVVAYSVASGVIYLLAEAGLPVDSTSTSLLLVLMFGAGTDYCLLLVARYRANLRAGKNVPDAVGRALPQAAPAMIASAVTVMAAMLAMLAGVLGLNRTLGPVNAIGIAIVLLASLTLLPAVLAVTGERAFWPGKPDAAEKAGGVWQTARRARPPAPARRGSPRSCSDSARVPPASRSTSCTADWLRQFKNETDGTRGYEVLTDRLPGRARWRRRRRCSSAVTGRLTPPTSAAVQKRPAREPRRGA